jgi:hypothetical protein
MHHFLRQRPDEATAYEDTVHALKGIVE